jgi:hypothetical protein
MLMHKDKFASKWVTGVKMHMASMCEDGFVLPFIALFYNDTSTSDILRSKRTERLKRAAVEQRFQTLAHMPWHSMSVWLSVHLTTWRDRAMDLIQLWRRHLSEEAIHNCISCPEFEFLKYLHKLTERMAAWRAYPDKHLPPSKLPVEFCDINGPLDAPFSVYERFHQIRETADAFIPAEMQRTMFAVMLSEMMSQPEQPTRAHRE